MWIGKVSFLDYPWVTLGYPLQLDPAPWATPLSKYSLDYPPGYPPPSIIYPLHSVLDREAKAVRTQKSE